MNKNTNPEVATGNEVGGNILSLFSVIAVKALTLAQAKARESQHGYVGLEHILWAALRLERTALQEEGDVLPLPFPVSAVNAVEQVLERENISHPSNTEKTLRWTPRGKKVLAIALRISAKKPVPLSALVSACLMEKEHQAVQAAFNEAASMLDGVRKQMGVE